MAIDIDPYSVLGVSQNATPDEVKASYRRAARRLHPDVNRDNPGAVVQLQDITAAYELLMDAERRRQYDRDMTRYLSDRLVFSMRVHSSKRAIAPMPEPQVLYLLAEISPDPRAQEQQQKNEARLNLTLVLDHSNSMNGTRLERVKVAAHQIIDQLNPEDILSVVSFNDRAEIIIPATLITDKAALKARISMMNAKGGTEIFQGLSAGVEQNRRFLAPKLVNHIILLTDGNTFGDQDRCLVLAQAAAKEGISISGMGLGQEWNDEFLDRLASSTGGSCIYINSSSAVVKFLNDHVRSLSNVFAERMNISVAPDADVKLESAFKLAPSPQPLSIDEGMIPLGSLQVSRPIAVLLQFEIPANLEIGFRSIARIVASGDILANALHKYQSLSDLSLEVAVNPPQEEPPVSILEALGKLTLYRMQERAQEALEQGDIVEATKRLERLATRLIAMGETELANQAYAEAQRVSNTSHLSEAGRKTLKFQTRYLLLDAVVEDHTE